VVDSTYPEIEARAARKALTSTGVTRGLTGKTTRARLGARGADAELPVSGDKARVNLLSTVTNRRRVALPGLHLHDDGGVSGSWSGWAGGAECS